MWNDQKNEFVVGNRVVLGTKQISEDGNRAQPGNAGPAHLILFFLNAAKNAGLPLAQANHLVDNTLRENRLGDAADGDRTGVGGDFDLDLQSNVVVIVDGRRHLDIHTDVLILELRIDQRADHRGGSAGLIGTGGNGDLFTDLHGCLLAIGGADAGILQQLGIGVGEQQAGRGAADGDRKIRGLEVGQVVESRGGG